MNYYRIQYSYIRCGRRVYEYDEIRADRAAEAAEDFMRQNDNLLGLRIEQVWIETDTAWEVCEFDY